MEKINIIILYILIGIPYVKDCIRFIDGGDDSVSIGDYLWSILAMALIVLGILLLF